MECAGGMLYVVLWNIANIAVSLSVPNEAQHAANIAAMSDWSFANGRAGDAGVNCNVIDAFAHKWASAR